MVQSKDNFQALSLKEGASKKFSQSAVVKGLLGTQKTSKSKQVFCLHKALDLVSKNEEGPGFVAK